MMRVELLTPAGDLVNSDTYNRLFTMHGDRDDLLLLVPSIPATLGNFLIPIMIGAKDLAFPRINLLSWYIYIVGGYVRSGRRVDGRRGHGVDVLRPSAARIPTRTCLPPLPASSSPGSRRS